MHPLGSHVFQRAKIILERRIPKRWRVASGTYADARGMLGLHVPIAPRRQRAVRAIEQGEQLRITRRAGVGAGAPFSIDLAVAVGAVIGLFWITPWRKPCVVLVIF